MHIPKTECVCCKYNKEQQSSHNGHRYSFLIAFFFCIVELYLVSIATGNRSNR